MISLRNIIAYSLIAITLSSTWLVPLVYVDFELRQEYIAKVLCVEREKPVTLCQGRCYLEERLGKAAEQQQNETQLNPVEDAFFFQQVSPYQVSAAAAPLIEEINYSISNRSSKLDAHLLGVFHPPRS